MELAKLKQEEDVKAKQMELAKLKQREDAKAKQMELVKLKQKEVAKNLQKEVEEKEDLGQGIKLEMVLIPAGKFMMGSPESENARGIYETQHEVTLTKPYYMGKYEVTQEQYESVMGVNPSNGTKGAKLPVTDVSWEDCNEFIKKLNANTDGGYRLPTEAEWEYACRAGTSTAYSFGDSVTQNDANVDGSSIKVVGSYKPNALGLYDMHGNVFEWCNDRYGDYVTGAVTDPKGPAPGNSHVLRGGFFGLTISAARSSNRVNFAPTTRSGSFGFRLARTVDSKTYVVPTVPKTDPTEGMPTTASLLVAPFSEAKAKEVQKEVAKSLQKGVEEKADLGKGIRMEFVLIPKGKFKMGSSESEKGRSNFETQHEVTLTKPYYMGKYEVTQEQWESVMGNNPSSRTKGAKLPVTNVSWEDCRVFVRKLNANTDGGYRLPTEAEWEYACRAGTTTAYSFGESVTPSDVNYNGSIKPVGNYKPNAFGLYDMHGNVWEWCNDFYEPYTNNSVIDPKGLAIGVNRVLRSGSFLFLESNSRSAGRLNFSPTERNNDCGFRLAKDP